MTDQLSATIASMAEAVIKLRDVTKFYGNHRGIDGVNLTVEPNEIFGFLGPNGAGKTTTIRCIMDFIRPSKGTVKVFGHDMQTNAVYAKAKIGFLPADTMLYPQWTGQQHSEFYGRMRGPADISKLANRLDLDLNVQVRHLSSGNKQKLALALALLGTPKLLIMDEPTKALDPLLQQEIYNILHEYKRAGGTVFVSSHNLPEVEKICDRVGVIKDGAIVASETIQTIRALSQHIITISTASKINLNDFRLPDSELLHHSDKHIMLKVHGDINPIIQAASRYKLKDLEVAHANLEDIFMEYYK